MNIKKTIKTGDYTEISYIQRTGKQQAYYKSGKRSRKFKPSSEKQKQQNIKNANKRLKQLIMGNFQEKHDHFVTLTFSDDFSPDEVLQDIRQFIARLHPIYALENTPLKYIYVIERGENANKKLHVHLLLSRCRASEISAAWGEVQGAGIIHIGKIKSIGKAMEYLTKSPVGNHRYTSSRNLSRPVEQCEQVSEKEHRAALAAVILDSKASIAKICKGNAPIKTYMSINPVTGCKSAYFSYFENTGTNRQYIKVPHKGETVPHCRI